MPSSITLTVSHLPTSASFFLSALQPLGYAYRGRTGQTIGFGSADDKEAHADFWITQETPGVPAGAAHVAFSAPSRAAVQKFFITALKAGGNIHGEPCVRDASGYYSGAVIDFDGNSIEAVHRPSYSDDKENHVKSVASRRLSIAAPSTIARSTMSRVQPTRTLSPEPRPQAACGDGIENLLTEARNAADVARQLVGQVRQHNSQPMQSSSGTSSGAVFGTLFGVAAGAALHYAFSSNNNGKADGNENLHNNHDNQSRPTGAARSVTDSPPRSEHSSYSRSREVRAIEAPFSSCYPRMITMHDNEISEDCASTSRARRSNSVASRSTISRRTSTRMIEAGPPTSYKAPTALTTTSSRHDGRSSRSRASSASRHTRSRSQSSERTIVRVSQSITSAARCSLPDSTVSRTTTVSKRSLRDPSPSRYPLPKSTTSKVTSVSKGSFRRISPSQYALPASTASSAPTALHERDRDPRDYPLPPSRTSTWAGSSTSKRESRSGRSELISNCESKSVISKSRDLKKLDVPKGELSPDDSVSQIGSAARSETSRRRRS